MTTLRVIRASEGRLMRWANGRGTTTEIAVHPADADLDSFDWRVSLADMLADGPFSTMPGIDRTLAVVDGQGIDLSVGTGHARRLDRSSHPFGFPGDVPAEARLVCGPVSNLNVMTRRGRFDHRVERLRMEGIVALSTVGITLVVVTGAVTAGALRLAAGDAVIFDGPPSRLRLDGRMAEAIVIRLRDARGSERDG